MLSILCEYNCFARMKATEGSTGQGAGDPKELKKKAALLVSQHSLVWYWFTSIWFRHNVVWDHVEYVVSLNWMISCKDGVWVFISWLGDLYKRKMQIVNLTIIFWWKYLLQKKKVKQAAEKLKIAVSAIKEVQELVAGM